MRISDHALQSFHQAQQRLDKAGRGLIEEPNADDAVELKKAKHQSRIAVELIKADDEQTDSLLDILA